MPSIPPCLEPSRRYIVGSSEGAALGLVPSPADPPKLENAIE